MFQKVSVGSSCAGLVLCQVVLPVSTFRQTRNREDLLADLQATSAAAVEIATKPGARRCLDNHKSRMLNQLNALSIAKIQFQRPVPRPASRGTVMFHSNQR